MDELLKKLIEVDRLARLSVENAEKARTDALSELEDKKLNLKKKKEAECSQTLEAERQKQGENLSEAQKDIADSCRRKIDALNARCEEKLGEWTETIFNNVIAG